MLMGRARRRKGKHRQQRGYGKCYYSTTFGIVYTAQLAFDPMHLESKMASALRNDVVEILNVTGRQVRSVITSRELLLSPLSAYRFLS